MLTAATSRERCSARENDRLARAEAREAPEGEVSMSRNQLHRWVFGYLRAGEVSSGG